jgi:hypothetical protein
MLDLKTINREGRAYTLATQARLSLESPLSPDLLGSGAPVAEAHVVSQAQAAGWNVSFCLYAHEMHGNKCSAKLHHFRAVDGGLQPGAMVESGIPKTDRGVVFAE